MIMVTKLSLLVQKSKNNYNFYAHQVKWNTSDLEFILDRLLHNRRHTCNLWKMHRKWSSSPWNEKKSWTFWKISYPKTLVDFFGCAQIYLAQTKPTFVFDCIELPIPSFSDQYGPNRSFDTIPLLLWTGYGSMKVVKRRGNVIQFIWDSSIPGMMH